MKTFIFDTETTGLIKNSGLSLDKQPKIIEFYGELVDDQTGEVLEEVEFLANPGFNLEEIITKITGLTDADLACERPFSYNAEKVINVMRKAEEVVAHNLAFDLQLVNFEMRRIGVDLNFWPEKRTCTVEKTEHLKGHRLRLTDLHHLLFGEPFDGAHRARQDVKALTRCFLELRSKGEL